MSTVLAADSFFTDRSNGGGCVADNGFCPDWIWDNLDRYQDPTIEHLWLTLIPVSIGFVIALSLGLLAHRNRWLIAPVGGLLGALYTIPSAAAFLLLLPVTGRGDDTAMIALTAYTLILVFRNVVTGLASVPAEAVDAANGMGLTRQQILLKIEFPLALPEILAGLRIAAATTVGLAAFAYLAGAGGLGPVLKEQFTFKSNVFMVGLILTLMAAMLDLIVLAVQRAYSPWQRARVG